MKSPLNEESRFEWIDSFDMEGTSAPGAIFEATRQLHCRNKVQVSVTNGRLHKCMEYIDHKARNLAAHQSRRRILCFRPPSDSFTEVPLRLDPLVVKVFTLDLPVTDLFARANVLGRIRCGTSWSTDHNHSGSIADSNIAWNMPVLARDLSSWAYLCFS